MPRRAETAPNFTVEQNRHRNNFMALSANLQSRHFPATVNAFSKVDSRQAHLPS